MGRRSTHTHEELRELVLRSAQEIIEAEGLSGLSAREIARKIGYSPGTLYNVFNNLDELVLHVEARLLDGLKEHLAAVDREGTPNEVIRRLAQAYLKFTHDRPKLWNLLLEHNVSAETAIPPWYHDRIEGLLTHVEKALAPLLVTNDPVSLKRSARVLWASVHGVTSLSTAPKLLMVPTETAELMIDELITTYLAGLQSLKERSAQ